MYVMPNYNSCLDENGKFSVDKFKKNATAIRHNMSSKKNKDDQPSPLKEKACEHKSDNTSSHF